MRIREVFKFIQSRLPLVDVIQTTKTPYPGRLIFDHLPKTGGQAVYTWLASELGTGNVCYVNNFDESVRNIIRLYGGVYSIISGHLVFAPGEGLDPRYQYVTLLREPVDRTVSWIYYLLNEKQNGGFKDIYINGARDFIESDGEVANPQFITSLTNPYVNHFTGIESIEPREDKIKVESSLKILKKYALVGRYEEMDKFIHNFGRLLGIPTQRKLEVVNKTSVRPNKDEISSRLMSKIIELNSMDIELYRTVSQWSSSESRVLNHHQPSSVSRWVKQDLPQPYVVITSGLTIDLALPPRLSTFVRGSQIVFELILTMDLRFENPYLCLHILDTDKRRVFASNSALLGCTKSISDPGTYRASFELNADFPVGRYYAGFVFIERAATGERQLTWLDSLCEFYIVSNGDLRVSGYCPVPIVFNVVKV